MAGEMVNSVLKELADRWLVEECREEGLIDVIAWDVEVMERAPVISCLSLY